ncbi:Hypothetical protein, putative [Bodo saltans]|uniref:Uncharacterized protein n=1 Tax=Bodo saltans TaxID=75058 RepID=A0A0S4KL31_BODSA|nr:Hypothetical protein, putative [Bodo saltans]|eukprot:CUI14295.1 Hypothetical protein, putative [Bodo saltans]
MTQLLWEYLQIGQGQHSSQDGGDDEAQPQKEQKWVGKRSKLFVILENEIARNEGADDRAQPPSSSASASKINIGGKEHLVPRVSATWVPGSVAHHLRYVPSIGPIAEVRGPHADVYSLAIVFGVMGTSTPAASATHELHNRVFLCSVLELARP